MAPVERYRVVVLGAGQVGKTALIARFLTGGFQDTHCPTLEDLHKYVFQLPEGKSFHMEILDTAGSHQFPAMRQLSIQSGRGFIIVYAFDDNKSFQDAITLAELVRATKGDEVPICLCGNKLDVPDVDKKILQTKTTMSSVVNLEASAKQNYNVKVVFETLFKNIVTPKSIDEKRLGESFGSKLKRRLSLVHIGEGSTRRNMIIPITITMNIISDPVYQLLGDFFRDNTAPNGTAKYQKMEM